MRVIQEITNEKISRMIDEFTASVCKEEKTMLKFDKYREDIDLALENHHAPWMVVIRTCLENTEQDTVDLKDAVNWLLSEYEPPLLENGDGLKPGDWIMVRDCEAQSFVKRQFLYFYGHRFYCARMGLTPFDDQIEWYMQARLPEEGE